MQTAGPCIDNGLSVDVEDWYQGFDELPSSSWHRYEHRLAGSLDRVLSLFQAHHVLATFFVLGWNARVYPHLIRRIAEHGHEVGTHGFAHRRVDMRSRDEFREDLRQSIVAIEDACGKRVLGHRAARFSIGPQSVWALDILLAQGIAYDSSIFPIRHYRYGWPAAPNSPCRLRLAAGDLVELPLPTLGFGRLRIPVAGGAYQRLLPESISHRALRAINRRGQAFILYLHPWELDPGQPRAPVPLHVACTHYANLRTAHGRFDRLLGSFKFVTLDRVAARADLPYVTLP